MQCNLKNVIGCFLLQHLFLLPPQELGISLEQYLGRSIIQVHRNSDNALNSGMISRSSGLKDIQAKPRGSSVWAPRLPAGAHESHLSSSLSCLPTSPYQEKLCQFLPHQQLLWREFLIVLITIHYSLFINHHITGYYTNAPVISSSCCPISFFARDKHPRKRDSEKRIPTDINWGSYLLSDLSRTV